MVVGGWKLDRRLGTGGQAEVWKARRKGERHASPVAIKILRTSGEKALQRFKNEIELTQKCSNSRIVSIQDSGLSEEHAYYVMPLAIGTLESVDFSSDTLRLLDWFMQAAEAVAYLHSLEPAVLHRDVKPSNMLILEETKCLAVADLGIAAEENSQGELTATFERVGTRWYRAPEVLEGAKATIESDIYGLGKSLERVLSGREIAAWKPCPVPATERSLSVAAAQAINAVISKACAHDREDRYHSVQDLLKDLPKLEIVLAENHGERLELQEEQHEEKILVSGPVRDLGWSKDALPFRPNEHVADIDPLLSGNYVPVCWQLRSRGFAFLRFEPLIAERLTRIRVEELVTKVPMRVGSFYGAYSQKGAIFMEAGPNQSKEWTTSQLSILGRDGSLTFLDGSALFRGERDELTVPSTALEKRFRKLVERGLKLYTDELGEPRLNVVAGLCDVAGSVLALPDGYYPNVSKPNHDDDIMYSWGDVEYEMLDKDLALFLGHVWDCFGMERSS